MQLPDSDIDYPKSNAARRWIEPGYNSAWPSARFWVYWNGSYTKLTLQPGESVELWTSAPHDEGYSSNSVTYSHCGHTITESYHSASRDCDEPMEHFNERFCNFYYLKVIPATVPFVDDNGLTQYRPDPQTMLPDWEQVKGARRQRDYFAEAAGY